MKMYGAMRHCFEICLCLICWSGLASKILDRFLYVARCLAGVPILES